MRVGLEAKKTVICVQQDISKVFPAWTVAGIAGREDSVPKRAQFCAAIALQGSIAV